MAFLDPTLWSTNRIEMSHVTKTINQLCVNNLTWTRNKQWVCSKFGVTPSRLAAELFSFANNRKATTAVCANNFTFFSNWIYGDRKSVSESDDRDDWRVCFDGAVLWRVFWRTNAHVLLSCNASCWSWLSSTGAQTSYTFCQRFVLAWTVLEVPS